MDGWCTPMGSSTSGGYYDEFSACPARVGACRTISTNTVNASMNMPRIDKGRMSSPAVTTTLLGGSSCEKSSFDMAQAQ